MSQPTKPLSVDEIFYELVARGALAASDVPQNADEIINQAKAHLIELVESCRPDHPVDHDENNAQENGQVMGYDAYEEAIIKAIKGEAK